MEYGRRLREFVRGWSVPSDQRKFGGELSDAIQPVSIVEDYDPWPTYVQPISFALVNNYTRFSLLPRVRPVKNLTLILSGVTSDLGYNISRLQNCSVEAGSPHYVSSVTLTYATVNGGPAPSMEIHLGWSILQQITSNQTQLNAAAATWPLGPTTVKIPSLDSRTHPNDGLVVETVAVSDALRCLVIWQELPGD